MKKKSMVSLDQMTRTDEGMNTSWECLLDDGNYLVVNDEGYWAVYPMPWSTIETWWEQHPDSLPTDLELDGGYSGGDELDALDEFNQQYPNDRAASRRHFIAGYMAAVRSMRKESGKTTSDDWEDLLDQLQDKFGIEFSVPDYNGYCKYLYPIDSQDEVEWQVEVTQYYDGTYEVMDDNVRKLE